MILSIDIGIRNLAMCIISGDKTSFDTFTLHLWDVFDTLDTEEHLCKSYQKNKKICNKKCGYKYKIEDNNSINFTCKSHFPKELLPLQKCNNFKKKMINDYLLQDIADIVLVKLQIIYDENKDLFEKLTSIVIELQPKINQKMKFTSHIIYGKLVELMRPFKCTIRFVRASQKLKAYTGPELECKLKGAYAKRKWLSIQYSKWFLENKFNKVQSEKWLCVFDSKSIQADMGDTLLMAINALVGVPKKQSMNFKKTNII
jgi:predicted DNA-binding protein YlxM (UPF0122 family)